jgi:hypothetical protein
MSKPKPDRLRCELCGAPLRSDNTMGVCKTTPQCTLENRARRRRKAREASGRQPGQRRPGVRPRRAPAIPPGTVFGRLTTLEESPQGTTAKVLCRCECGTEHRVQVQNLRRGITRSCGCLKRENAGRPRGPGGIYLPAGFTSGRLTTLEDAIKSHADVRVRCECGTETAKNAQRVKSGKVVSCGCAKGTRTHGLSGHPLYPIWQGIVGRTSRPTDKAYKRYGAIGRTICAGWTGIPDGFLRFAADMGERPPGLSVERVNNSAGYWCGHCEECVRLGRPANCRWATLEEQAANRGSAVQVIRERDALALRLAEAERLLAALSM